MKTGDSGLTPADYAALLGRWIAPEQVSLAGLRRVNSMDGAQLVGRNGSGDFAGIAIPYRIPGEERIREYRIRRDHPDREPDGNGGFKDKGKYLAPPGRGNMLYFPPGVTVEHLSDSRLPVIIVEGEFKAIALDRLSFHGVGDASSDPRFVAVGLPGVWNWRGTIGKDQAADGSRIDIKGPIPDLDRIQWKRRRVIILFDRDVEKKEQVGAARSELAKELQRRGAQVLFFTWPKDTAPDAKGVDDLLAAAGPDLVLHLIAQASRPTKPTATLQRTSEREFNALGDGRYQLSIAALGVTFEVDRLRRERNELIGELCVRCELPGAKSVDGVLSTADFNFSSARARTERAKLLQERSKANDLDWIALVEEFSQRVLTADRSGLPAIDLRSLQRPTADDELHINGLVLPRRHPTILFGDGGSAKSYIALYLAGAMAERGFSVGLFDWELSGDDHRDRLERLYPNGMPRILYARCERPLVYEVDRLRRITRENDLDFVIYDSIAFASDGPPEAAEVAGRYFRAVREIGCGSLHVAHISKGENADQKPFGSAFWHNGARSTWYVKRDEACIDSDELRIGLFNRKSNLGRLRSPLGYQITFTDDQTIIRRNDVAESSDLAGQLSVRQRMAFLLRKGAMDAQAVAEELDADIETVRRTARRNKSLFTILENGRLALLQRSAA